MDQNSQKDRLAYLTLKNETGRVVFELISIN